MDRWQEGEKERERERKRERDALSWDKILGRSQSLSPRLIVPQDPAPHTTSTPISCPNNSLLIALHWCHT